ncbi:MAG: beta-galactosidase [bacterium]|nr:beta-galactosidase [bacterium]
MKLKHPFKYPILIAGVILIFFTLFWGADFLVRFVTPTPKIDYGVTFSTVYSKELGLDPPVVFQAVLDDLGVKKVRLPIYWDSVEKEPGEFNFQDTDILLKQAEQRGAEVILAIGYKVPRWPECFAPSWAKDLPKEQFQQQILQELAAAVDHYQNHPAVTAWQVENEPLLNFGLCRMFDKSFLESEVNLVRSKDSRPIVLTDSGELGLWVTALQYSDIMGTSLYRTVWDPHIGYFNYPFPPLYYRLKANLTQRIFAPLSQGVMVSELQAEPWAPGKSITKIPLKEQIQFFSLDNLKGVVDFTTRTDIKSQYFWGVEWWYYMKLHNHPEYWEYAQTLIR